MHRMCIRCAWIVHHGFPRFQRIFLGFTLSRKSCKLPRYEPRNGAIHLAMISMKTISYGAMLSFLFASAAASEGQPSRGADLFERNCAACHSIITPEGRTIAGKGRENAPNLNGLFDRTPGSQTGFRYGVALASYATKADSWDRESFVAYVMDPTGFPRTRPGDRRARSRMSYRLRNERDAIDIFSFILETQSR